MSDTTCFFCPKIYNREMLRSFLLTKLTVQNVYVLTIKYALLETLKITSYIILKCVFCDVTTGWRGWQNAKGPRPVGSH
jgi:hypothetical protein